jgi:hypothetical protein
MGGIVPEEEVALRDGSHVLIRPVQPGDKALFAESWEHFGEESRYRRFLGAKGDLTARELLGGALRAAAKGLVRLRP